MKKNYSSPYPKRFYKEVTTQQVMEQWNIALDGRVLKTMAKHPLHVGSKALAEAVATEWREVKEEIRTEWMPLTRLANISIDRVPRERAGMMADMMLYAETDLLCHRAREEQLRAQQAEQWDKVLSALEHYDIKMVVTTGVIPQPQSQASLDAIKGMLAKADDAEFAALAMMVPLFGSILLTLAVWKKLITIDAAVVASRLDESYQQERWGRDPEADALWEAKLKELQACGVWLQRLS